MHKIAILHCIYALKNANKFGDSSPHTRCNESPGTRHPTEAPMNLRTLEHTTPALFWLILALLAMALPTSLMGQIDHRTVGDLAWTANVWAKPLKFQLSIALHLLTIVWAMAWMQRHCGMALPGHKVLVVSLAITVLFEVVYITVQGARGAPSHFNRATPLESVGASLMAGGASVLVGASAWIGAVALWRWYRLAPSQREPMLLAIGLGFVLMFVLAGYTGSALGQYRGPFVQVVKDAQAGLPLTGWRTDIGDLRIAHFWGVHSMQAVPLLAWPLSRLTLGLAHGGILAGAIAWSAMTVALMQLALLGKGVL
ncbi:MAG: hypothetical protein ACO1PM_28120 [Acidovorax sp.]